MPFSGPKERKQLLNKSYRTETKPKQIEVNLVKFRGPWNAGKATLFCFLVSLPFAPLAFTFVLDKTHSSAYDRAK